MRQEIYLILKFLYCRDNVYILYGSQTGNSEFIAKELCDKCNVSTIPAIVHPLNAVKKTVLKEVAKAIVIVCATTGNGDAPENAEGWWRANKLRSAVRNRTSHLFS